MVDNGVVDVINVQDTEYEEDDDPTEMVDLLNSAYDKDLRAAQKWLIEFTELPKVISYIIFDYHLPVKPAVAAFFQPFLPLAEFTGEVEHIDRWIFGVFVLTRAFEGIGVTTCFALDRLITLNEVWRRLNATPPIDPRCVNVINTYIDHSNYEFTIKKATNANSGFALFLIESDDRIPPFLRYTN